MDKILIPENLQSPVFDAFCEIVDRQHLYICDVKTNVWRWSLHSVKYFGLPGETVENLPEIWLKKVHADDRERLEAAFNDLFSGKARTHSCEYRIKNAGGEYVWVSCHGCMAYDANGNMNICAGIITHLGLDNKFDTTTGLLSTHEFRRSLEQQINEPNSRFGILLIGIDHFRRINELNNYTFGNNVLSQFAKKLSDLTPKGVELYRLDGDKFAFVCKAYDKNQISQLFATAATLTQNGIITDGKHISFAITGGAIFYPENSFDADELFTGMEHALEYAKNNNRENLTFFTLDLQKETVAQYKFRQTLKECIANNFEGFNLYYQPTVTADGTHELIGAEALLRWQHPEFGFISPAVIIPVLEESGKIVSVGKWVVSTALRQVKKWLAIKPDMKISINVSLIQFLDTSFRTFVLQEIEKTGFPKKQLILELTESCNVIQPERVRTELNLFRENGIQIALDDFGTGYASLSILRDLAADWIKVDHSFVAEIAHNGFDRALTESLINLCKKLNLSVCVEGIETEEIKTVIQGYSPMMLQGYLFSRPLNIEQFEEKYINQ